MLLPSSVTSSNKPAEKRFGLVTNQIIISTQSAPLLSEFSPEDVIVVERQRGESSFRRLNPDDLSEWLTEYSLGELWQKNLLDGRPKTEDASQLVPDGDD
jgi:hypothetical protein